MTKPSTPNDLDAIFKLPLGEFTAARNALAAQLKRDGRDAEAREAKALAKPSAAAWAVNQLYWRHRKSFDRLIEAGERLRRAQAAPRTGDGARDPVNARREAIVELAELAATLLREGDHNPTRDLMRRVTSTLEALSIYGTLPGGPAAGRLTAELEPPGFEALAGFLPAKGDRAPAGKPIATRATGAVPTPKRATSEKQTAAAARREEENRKRLVDAAKAAVREVERAFKSARKDADRAAAKRETAATRVKDLDAQRARIERELARVSNETQAAQALAKKAEAHAADAARAAEEAERALGLARDRLHEMAPGED